MTDIPRDNDEELLALFDDVNDQSFLYFRKRVGEFLEARAREAEKRGAEKANNLTYAKYKKLWAGLCAVQPILSNPYPDDPRWTPWSRFVEPRMQMVQAAFKGENIGELAAMGRLQQIAPKPQAGDGEGGEG